MTEKQNEHRMLMQFIEQDCFVDAKQKLEYPPASHAKNCQNESKLPSGLGPFATVQGSQGATCQTMRSPAPSAWPHSSANAG